MKPWLVKFDAEKPHTNLHIPRSIEQHVPYDIEQYRLALEADHISLNDTHVLINKNTAVGQPVLETALNVLTSISTVLKNNNNLKIEAPWIIELNDDQNEETLESNCVLDLITEIKEKIAQTTPA